MSVKKRVQSVRKTGEVRIRSNVCDSPTAWNLVPGELAKKHSLSNDRPTEKQRAEMMYYSQCCICHRTIFQIEEDGCDQRDCRAQGIISTAEGKHRRTQRQNNISLAEDQSD